NGCQRRGAMGSQYRRRIADGLWHRLPRRDTERRHARSASLQQYGRPLCREDLVGRRPRRRRQPAVRNELPALMKAAHTMNGTPAMRAMRQRGMSLVELLVALGLSATLMAGVVGVFVTMFQADRTQEAVSRLQESGRFALNFLS